MRTGTIFPAVFLGALLCLSVGCAPRETPAELATKHGILIVGNGADPEDLDPHIITGVSETRIAQALFEGLVMLDGKTLEPRPGAAASWSISDDGLAYRFALQPEGRWSNGGPVRAQDFAFSLRRALTPTLGAKYAAMLFSVKNARAFYEGKLPAESLGIRAVDDRTLEIALERPDPMFLAILAHPIAFPVRADILEKHGDPFKRGGRWTRAGNLVGNGPFALKRWSVNDAVEVARNDFYWDSPHVELMGVRFLPIADQAAEERAFRAGQLHVTDSVPLNKLENYLSTNDHRLRLNPWLGSYYYIFNTLRPPLDDAKVRRALSLAVDREAIARVILKDAHTPATTFIPSGTADFSSPESPAAFDPAKARALLAEAGYPDGNGFPSLSLLYNTSDMHRPIAEAVQAMWKRHLNVDIRLLNVSWGAYLSMRQERDFDIARASWVADFNDPSNFLENFQGDNPLNRTGWKNDAFDALLKNATVSPKPRADHFQRAEQILLDEAPLIPIFHYNRAFLVRPEVTGWDTNILDQRPLKNVRFSK